jgi:hypothetical protein
MVATKTRFLGKLKIHCHERSWCSFFLLIVYYESVMGYSFAFSNLHEEHHHLPRVRSNIVMRIATTTKKKTFSIVADFLLKQAAIIKRPSSDGPFTGEA